MKIFPELVDEKNPIKSLDVQLLTDYCITPVFGISDLRGDERIEFIGGPQGGMKEMARRCNVDCQVALACYPVNLKQFFAIADGGLIMPPKSTWFAWIPRSGMIVRVMK